MKVQFNLLKINGISVYKIIDQNIKKILNTNALDFTFKICYNYKKWISVKRKERIIYANCYIIL